MDENYQMVGQEEEVLEEEIVGEEVCFYSRNLFSIIFVL